MGALACPKCGCSLAMPQPVPQVARCPKCGAHMKIKAKRGAPASGTVRSAQAKTELATTGPKPMAAGGPRMPAGHVWLRELARGGLGVVHLARHQVLGDLRAVKRPLSKEGKNQRVLLGRFCREVQTVAALRHDNVIRAYDAGTDEDGPYLVMEFLDGEPLNLLIDENGPLPVPQASEMIRQAALGLQAAHERGLIHRDIKPSNLMLTRANAGRARVVVIDWGLSKYTQEAPTATDGLTVVGTTMGSADFVAPEQVADASGVDIRADIYGLGATFYNLLAGKPPFDGRPYLDKFLAQQRDAFPPLTQARSDVPADLLAVLQKMVEKNPARRFTTPEEVSNAVRPYCCGAAAPQLLGLLKPPLTADQIAAASTPFDDADLLFEVDAPRLEVWQQRFQQACQWIRARPPYLLAAGGGLIVLVLLILVLWLVN
jgi:serine/threonine protein kinase